MKYIVYHGTNADFNKFSYDFIGTIGSEEGIGFYFSKNKKIADKYAKKNLLECEITLNKLLSNKKITLKKTETKKLIKEIQKEKDFLSNYGDIEYEGLNNVLNEAIRNLYSYCNSDTEILADICHSLGNIELVLKTVKKVLGYDGIIEEDNKFNDTIYIVFDNEDIIIKENK